MQNTRQRIKQYLEKNKQATALELSLAFEMTSANIRHHLKVLVEEGIIEMVGQNAPDGRGRRTKLYMLTRKIQTQSLNHLTSALLEGLSSRSQKQFESRLTRVAVNLTSTLPQEGTPITLKLNQAVLRLNDLGYHSHWEAHADAPRIILGQCPYASIIELHPELCQMDVFLLNNMLGKEVKLIDKTSRLPGEPKQCIFKMKP